MPMPSVRKWLATALLAAATLSTAAAGPAHAAARIAGNVWVVDQDGSTVTIIDAGKKLTFSYGADTIIRRGSTDRTVADLRRGDRIVVSLDDSQPDALRARLIAIAGPPAVGGSGLNVFR